MIMSLLFGSFPSYCMYAPYAVPRCSQARKINCLCSWGNFKCYFKAFLLHSAPKLSQSMQFSVLFFPLENHHCSWMGDMNSIPLKSLEFSIISHCLLCSCFMLLSEKYTSITWAEREINPCSLKTCTWRQAKTQQVISAGRNASSSTPSTLNVNALVVSSGKQQIKLLFYLSR